MAAERDGKKRTAREVTGRRALGSAVKQASDAQRRSRFRRPAPTPVRGGTEPARSRRRKGSHRPEPTSQKEAWRWLRLLGWATAGVVLFAVTAQVVRAAPAPTVQLTAPLVGDKARAGEAEIGNLVADALRAATGADIALVAGGELKDATLPSGPASVDQVISLLSFPQDLVVVLSLDGATLRKALAHAISQYPRKNKGFLQVSGLEYRFGPSGLVSVRTSSGAPLQDGAKYRVAMSSSLASGAYGYYRLWSRAPDASAGPGGGLTLAGALQGYLKDRRQIDVRVEGRIIAQQ